MKKFKEKTDHLIETLEDQLKKLEKYVAEDHIEEETPELETEK